MLALIALVVMLTLRASGEVCPEKQFSVCELQRYIFKSATANQLVIYKESTKGPDGYLTTNTGRPIEESEFDIDEANMFTSDLLVEGLTDLVREQPIPRIVHPKGGGAFGYFIVTDDVSDVIYIDMFNKVGKKTPAVTRFSPTHSDLGSADTVRDSRGFATKFFTEKGIFDLLMLSFPVFPIKNPIKFPFFTHVNKKNSQTFKKDANMFWDFVTSNQESAFFSIIDNSDAGIPCSYATMPGYAIHTFAFCNAKGKRYFGRFSLIADDVNANKGLTTEQGQYLAGLDADYLNEELYQRIASGKYPVWTLYIQALSEEDVKKASVKNVFDPTYLLDEKKYPPRPIGKLYLNKNPENYFRDIEQLTYCVRHLPPGINGVDVLFQMRSFVYLDAQNHRLGPNHNKIPVNQPTVDVNTYHRDGAPPVDDNGNNGPNYYPNYFNGPVPIVKSSCPRFHANIKLNPNATNFEQAAKYFNGLPKAEQERMVENIAESLSKVTAIDLQKKAILMYLKIDKLLGDRIDTALEAKLLCSVQPPKSENPPKTSYPPKKSSPPKESYPPKKSTPPKESNPPKKSNPSKQSKIKQVD